MSEETLWFAVVFVAPAQASELLTASLLDAGVDSTELRDRSDGKVELVTYVEADSPGKAANRARAMNLYMPAGIIEESRIEAVDQALWHDNWKEHFPPVEVGQRLLVLPPWEVPKPEQSDRAVVVINPGLAFGTGNHETTLGCLEILDKLVRGGELVADVGTGSGILGIAALKLGAAETHATDIDVEAVNAAAANAVSNDVAGGFHVSQASGPPPLPPGNKEGFDIVLANILAATLLNMADGLTSCVKSGGHLILAGIESARLPLIELAFTRRGFSPTDKLISEEWATVCLSAGSQPA